MSDYDSPDRRSNDAQLGYLRGKVESLDSRLSTHLEEEERVQRLIAKQLERIEEQLSMYRHFTFFFRTLGVCIVAVLASNWQEAKEAWYAFWIPRG